MLLLRLIMRQRQTLPPALWQKLRDSYWFVFWRLKHREMQIKADLHSPTLSGSERATIVEALADEYPIGNVLEVGCAYAPNFHLLAPRFPDVSWVGLDREKDTLEGAKEFAQSLKLPSVRFDFGSASDLSRYKDKSFDIVYTCASLLYVGPDRIIDVLREMLRVCRQRLILLEQHAVNPYNHNQPLGQFVPRLDGAEGYWLRDYLQLLTLFVPPRAITIREVENPIWENEQWQNYAALITVDLQVQTQEGVTS